MKLNAYTFLRLVILLLIVMLFVGCKSKGDTKLDTATITPIITVSPVTGKPVDPTGEHKAADSIKLDKRLLVACPVPLPKVPVTGNAVAALDVKRKEAKTYYDCAYRHNALVKFLAEKLGIVPDEGTEVTIPGSPTVKVADPATSSSSK